MNLERVADKKLNQVTRRIGHDLRGRIPKISSFKHERVVVKAPVRMEAGGWSDIALYVASHQATIFNFAANINGKLPIVVTAETIANPQIELRVKNSDGEKSRTLEFNQGSKDKDLNDTFHFYECIVGLAGVSRMKVKEKGVRLTVDTPFPIGTGLGTSCIIGASALVCLYRLAGIEVDYKQICLLTTYLEHVAKIYGGMQDQVAGLFGGANLVEWGPKDLTRLEIERVQLDEEFMRVFEQRTILYNTKTPKSNRNSTREIVKHMLSGDRIVEDVLGRGRRLHFKMRKALRDKDILGFGRLAGDVWRINQGMLTFDPKIHSVMSAASPFISGGGVVGSGPCVLLVSKSEKDANRLRRILGQDSFSTGELYDFSLNTTGIQISEETS